MVFLKECYKFGKEKEAQVLPIIQKYFSSDIQPAEDKFSKFDFFDDDTIYELKSRTNKKDTYPDTMITLDKCTDDKPLILLFNYIDCLAYIKYDKEQFTKYKTKMFSKVYIKKDEKLHLYIPISDLTVIETY